MKITFIGATGSVTGSMTLVELKGAKILVDCGLFQGEGEHHEYDLSQWGIVAKELKAIILTHAHLDHSGLVPYLVRRGFRGEVIGTRATLKLVKVILTDSAKLQEESAKSGSYALYDASDVNVAVSLFKAKNFHETFSVENTQFLFRKAGHILGAASLLIHSEDSKVLFSGDLGRNNDALIESPEPCPLADVVIMESTYGDRVRSGDVEKELYSFLVKISREERVGIIASFAVARAQLLLTLINEFFHRHPEEKIRVVMDGPMMKEANKIYKEFAKDTKLPTELYNSLDEIDSIDSYGEWESLSKKEGPLLIITSSGMITGGRVWRYLKNWQTDPSAMLFLPGYQAEGTAGRLLAEGGRDITAPDKEMITWTGEVITSNAFSSHADQNELIEWLGTANQQNKIFLIHGEARSKVVLKTKLSSLGFTNVDIPNVGESFTF